MRDTGPVNKQLTGDTEAAGGEVSVARTQLGILKNQMQQGGLAVGARSVTMPDGTSIRVMHAAGVSRVAIDSPTSSTTPEKPPKFPVPKAHFPKPPQPPHNARMVFGFNGIDTSGLFPMVPVEINGDSYTDATKPKWFDMSSKNTPATFKPEIVDIGAGIYELANYSWVVVLDDTDVVRYPNQPTKWKASFPDGTPLNNPPTPANAWYELVKGGFDYAGILTVPILVQDTLVKYEASGGTPGGIGVGGQMDAAAPMIGFIMAKKSPTHPGENINGTEEFVYFGTALNVWINGIQTVTDAVRTYPSTGPIDVTNGCNYEIIFTCNQPTYDENHFYYDVKFDAWMMLDGQNVMVLDYSYADQGYSLTKSSPCELSGDIIEGTVSNSGVSTMRDAAGNEISFPCTITITCNLIP